MTGRTLERLRDTTTALGRVIGPEDIPPLRLPTADWRPSRPAPAVRWLRPAGA